MKIVHNILLKDASKNASIKIIVLQAWHILI